MAWISWSWIWAKRSRTSTSRKPQKCSSKTMRWKRMHVLLRADQRLKQNHVDVLLLAHPQELYQMGRELGPILNHKIIRSPTVPCRRNWLIFFGIVNYLQNHFVHSRHWSDEKWKSIMAGGGGGNKKRYQYCPDSSGEYFTSELFMVIHAAVLLILHHRTMSWFRTIFSSAFFTLDVQSSYIPSWIQDWYWEVKIWATERQTVFFLPVDPMDKEHKDPETIDLEARVLYSTCIQPGRNIKTRCIGSTLNLLKRKVWSSIELDRTLSFCTIHSKAVRMETEEIIYEKLYESPRPPPKISLRNDWMKELGSEVARQAGDNQPTQPNPNPIHRTERPVVTEQTSRSSAQEIDTRSSHDCENTNLFVERLGERQRHRQRRRCRSW